LPHNYQSVHDLFLEFRLGPYADLPVTFSDVLNRYGAPMLVGGIGIIALLAALLAMVASRNRALQQSQERLQLAAGVFAHAQEGIMITDADARIVDVNDTFLVLTGYRRDEVIGQNPNLLSSGKQDAAFYRRMWQELLEQGFWRGEMHNRRKDGREYIQQLSISAVRAPDGQISHFIGLSSDITQLKENEEKLVRMAYFDALTGLPNRRLLTDRLGQTLARAQRKESLLAICYLDLDGFKPVNDTWGHAVGDRVLVEAARRLSAAVRGGDTVSRLGGDEFVVLLADLVNFDECEAVIRRLLTAMATPFVLPAGEGHLSASIGVTLYPVDDADPDMLIRHADHAMYVAKQAGRNQFHLFDVARDA
jgi:diguanylate cyclase (GGDEF)-like protein/PAS domain S-box-containing protein